MAMDPIIAVEHVHKSFGKLKAVDDLSFAVEPATCFGLLGPNGAGKTTMMKMIYGKSRRDAEPAGRISVFGHDPNTHELDIKALTAVVPQENNLDEELNVFWNLLVYSKFYGLPAAEARRRIAELLAFVELSDRGNARIKDLSGGMKRRLIMARALINQPRLLILDEPTTGLDPQVRHLIWDKLRQLKKQGLTILLTTHYMEEAFQLCDRILIMHKGRKIMEGRPVTLLTENIEPYVLEIHNPDDFGHIPPDLPDSIRREQTEDRLLLYGPNMNALRDLTDRISSGAYFLRQANLEDLFMKTTGRGLHE